MRFCLATLLLLFAIGCDKENHSATASSSPTESRLLRIQVGGRIGFIDRSGKIVITPQFESVGDFSEGLASVCVGSCDTEHLIGWRTNPTTFKMEDLESNAKWGYIDESGKIVINPTFDSAGTFSEGLAAVCTGKTCWTNRPNQPEDRKYGYVDKGGKLVIAPQFASADEFKEGLAAVRIGDSENGKWGFIDTHGRFVINPQFDYALSFHNGIAEITLNDPAADPKSTLKEYKRGYIDRSGKIVWEPTR